MTLFGRSQKESNQQKFSPQTQLLKLYDIQERNKAIKASTSVIQEVSQENDNGTYFLGKMTETENVAGDYTELRT